MTDCNAPFNGKALLGQDRVEAGQFFRIVRQNLICFAECGVAGVADRYNFLKALGLSQGKFLATSARALNSFTLKKAVAPQQFQSGISTSSIPSARLTASTDSLYPAAEPYEHPE